MKKTFNPLPGPAPTATISNTFANRIKVAAKVAERIGDYNFNVRQDGFYTEVEWPGYTNHVMHVHIKGVMYPYQMAHQCMFNPNLLIRFIND